MLQQLKGISETCLNILSLMLKANASERPSASEALSHRWFKSDLDAIINLLAINSSVAKKSGTSNLFIAPGFSMIPPNPNPSGGIGGVTAGFNLNNFNQSFALLPRTTSQMVSGLAQQPPLTSKTTETQQVKDNNNKDQMVGAVDADIFSSFLCASNLFGRFGDSNKNSNANN